ncbi:nucleotidyltransferase domain-containing protein [Sphingobacterium sp. SRCM116780]|uniref:nucleotidyltransferase domain-containing protein n=1 Tax=Sphingobacterium sp. SRCM116780 TaxID=2907623 RepID=UPI001F309191|nr:nucleotidyltransferase domain-containing protein [Sphingobacterium sp. SRCM116780]UIR57359.1 nucleotidyltransferase domain-containing protein [Sphingobacterium sp. SRCM116780]
MNNTYLCTLIKEIETKENIKILYACESGSRAWGFPSQDSDYDIRFIYCRQMADYLTIFSEAEDIRYPIVDDLDIYGWDIRKVLKLLYKSNCTLYEWLQSPICYGDYTFFKDDFIPLLEYAPNIRAHMHHYLGLFHRKMEALDLPTIGLKSFFYLIRSLLSAEWIATYRSYAPMEIKHLKVLLPDDRKLALETLITLKGSVKEDFNYALEKEWRIYLKDTFVKLRVTVDTIPVAKMPVEPLDHYFFNLVQNENDDH